MPHRGQVQRGPRNECFGKITWTSDSEETAVGKMGEKSQGTGDNTLSLSDIPVSAGNEWRCFLLCPSVSKLWGQETRHVSWYGFRGFVVTFSGKENSGAATSSPGEYCCIFL